MSMVEDIHFKFAAMQNQWEHDIRQVRYGSLKEQAAYIKEKGAWLDYVKPERRTKVLDRLTDQELIKVVKENPDAIYNIRHPGRALIIKLAAGIK